MSAPLFRGRITSVLVLLLAQLGLAWASATAVTIPLLSGLRRHPDGYRALLADNGRMLLELAAQQRDTLTIGGALVGLVVTLYAGLWFALGATLPVLGAVEPAPPLHRAASYSVRRLPTLAGLGALALAGYALAAGSGWLAYWQLQKHDATWIDVRAKSLYEARALVPVLLIVAVVTVWHDLARVCAVGTGRGVWASTLDAIRWQLRSPLRTMGAASLYALVSALGLAVALLMSRLLGGREALAPTAALIATQQLTLVWRFAWRARWFFFLGAMFRERNAPSTEVTAE